MGRMALERDEAARLTAYRARVAHAVSPEGLEAIHQRLQRASGGYDASRGPPRQRQSGNVDPDPRLRPARPLHRANVNCHPGYATRPEPSRHGRSKESGRP